MPTAKGGGRAGMVLNDSPLFTGVAGSGYPKITTTFWKTT